MAFAVVAVVIVAGGAWFWTSSRQASEGAAASNVAAPLPTGPLKSLGATVTDARFLSLADLKKTAGGAQATVLVIGKSPTSIDQTYAMVTRRETISCADKRISNELAGDYDAEGVLKNTALVAGAAGRDALSNDFEVAAVCGPAAPSGRDYAGYVAARREVQAPPDAVVARAKADPKDAAAWAWLCAADVRGRRPGAPISDCETAVRLNPDDLALSVDRAFGHLSVGARAPADAGFKAILAKDAKNAPALFGRSLVAAMGHDLTTSRRLRDQALDIDPKVPDWIEANYGFQVSDAYRAR